MVELGGLQYRKYLIKFPENSKAYEAKAVSFERRSVKDRAKAGRLLLPVLSECYELLFDQDTNLLHSITYL